MFQILPIDNIHSRVISDNEEEFRALYNYFRIEDPGLKYTPRVRMGYSDGKQDIIKLDGTFYWGLKPKIINWIVTRGLQVQDFVPVETNPISTQEWSLFMSQCDLPFEPYDYQVMSAKHLLEQKRHIGLAATGAGKSLILYIMIRWFIWKQIKTMLIVPDVGLVEQMFSDLKDYYDAQLDILKAELNEAYTKEMTGATQSKIQRLLQNRINHNFTNFEDTVCKIYAGHDKFTNHLIKISTWQSVFELAPSGYFQDIEALLFDETHRAKSTSYRQLNDYCNASFKIGMSGTMNPVLLDQLILEGTIGPATTIITPKQLIDRGLATKTRVQPVFLVYDKDTVDAVRKMDWNEESKFFRLLEKKIDFIAQFAKGMTSKGNGIVLAKNVDAQKAYLLKMTSLHENTTAIMREVKPEERESIRKSVDSFKDRIIIASSAIMTTGINIKSLCWAILAQVVKSEIPTIQTLGRLLRLYDGKDSSVIFDVVDDCRHYSKSGRAYPNHSFKHFEERLKAYAKYQYPVEKPIVIRMF